MEWSSVLRRVGFAAVAALVVLSVVFGFVMLTDDPNEALLQYQLARQGDASAEEVEAALAEYQAERGLDRPLHQQYVDFVVGLATLELGVSANYGQPVADLLVRSLGYTALWVVPGVALSMVGSVLVGLFAAMRQHTASDALGRGVAYLGLSVPNYVLALLVPLVFGVTVESITIGGKYGTMRLQRHIAASPDPSLDNLQYVLLPMAVLTTSLLAAQVRHVRSEAVEYVSADFVKLLRAKGASDWRVARHLFRNTAIPLVSLFFADMLGVLVLNVFVLETVLNVPGVGALTYVAFFQRDLPILLSATAMVLLVGVVGNLLQDFAYATLDPRVDAME